MFYITEESKAGSSDDYPVLSLSLRVYTGESADEDKLIWNKPLMRGFSSCYLFLLITEMPYTEKITVVFETGGEGQAHHVIDTQTLDISDYMIQDLLREKRLQLAGQFDEYYAQTFGQNPPGAQNLPDDTYKAFADVRYLLRDAYEKGKESILFVAAAEESELTALYDAAIARFTALATLQTKINEGGGEHYKSVPGVMKTAVVIGGGEPQFAYVSVIGPHTESYFQQIGDDQNRTLIPLYAALEAAYPGIWRIGYGSADPSIYITSISFGGGDGAAEPGSPNGNLVYTADNIWATLGFSQYPVSDRGVIRIGGALAAGQIPELGTGVDPNKDDLIWALAAIYEVGGEGKWTQEQTEAVTAAQSMVNGWLPTATVTQNTVDSALAALTAAFPSVKLIRYDLPQEVLNVMAAIAAIGNITPESGAAIASARNAYNALSSENQALVPNYATLAAAEDAFALLTAARPEYLSALGDVTANNLGKLSLTVGTSGGEWALLAAVRAGAAVPGSAFANGYLSSLNKLLNDGGLDGVTTTNYTDFARITLALSSLGLDASSYGAAGKTYNIAGQLTDYNKVVSQGINGAIFALIALDSKPYLTENAALRDQYVNYILGKEINGGGWALSGDKADPDITAMALQALARYRDKTGVDAAVTRGLAALKASQDATYGGFYSWGQYNSESAAQTIVALTALGIDPTDEAWTVNSSNNPLTALMTFYDAASHGFRHALNGGVNDMATEQAAYALAAYDRFVNRQNALYDMSDAFGGSSAQVNKNELNAAISLSRSLKQADYTPETWGALAAALTAAEGVSSNAGATQEQVNAARSALLTAIGNLITAEAPAPGVNTERLTVAKAIAAGLTETDYTANTWDTVKTALSTAQSVSQDAEQTAVDTAADALLGALAALELKDVIDATLLSAAVNAEKTTLTKAEYSPETWAEYGKALTAAQAEADSPASQQSADFAAQALIVSLGELTKATGEDYTAVTGVLTAIKTAVSGDARYTDTSLAALANAAERAELVNALCWLTLKPLPLNNTLLNAAIGAGTGLATGLYTPESWETLSLVLVSAQLKQTQGLHTGQSAVNIDARSILAAMRALAYAENTSGANKTLLNLYITQAELLNSRSYSAASWQTLQTALTAAQTVASNAGAAQAEVDAARKALIDAIDALVKLADKTALNAAIAEAQAIMNKGYTNDSWKYLTDALTAARLVRDNETAAQAAVDAAANDLRLAVAGLEYPTAPPSTGIVPGAPTINVSFRLIGATRSNRVDEDDALSTAIDLGDGHGYRGSEYVTWIATRGYVLNEGATVYDLFIQAVAGAGLSQVGADKNYVKTITAPAYYGGYALSEFTNGQRSGWMYTINGRHPGYGLMEQQLANGDEVIWHYVNDYAYEVADWFEDESEYPTLATDSGFYNKWLEAENKNPPNDGSVAPGVGQNGDDNAAGDKPDTATGGGLGGSQPDVVAQKTVETAPAKPDNAGKATVTVETSKVTTAVDEAKKAVETAKAEGKTNAVAEVIIPVKTEAGATAKSIEADIPAAAVKAIAEAKDLILTIESDVSTLTLDTATLTAIAETAKAGETIKIAAEAVDNAEALNDKQREKVGDNPVIEVNITVGTTAITNLGGTVTVSVPYTPPATVAETDQDLLTVYYLDDDGNITEMKGAKYDAATGKITFATTHFSKFLISEWINPFTDIAKGEWYYKTARYAYSNTLITGTTDTTFAPQATLTRAMLATILYRNTVGGGVHTVPSPETPFTDVVSGQWYTPARAWASSNNLITGVGNNKFAPNDPITREQFATLLYRYTQWSDAGNGAPRAASPTDADLSAYTDAETISDWAREAMAWAVSTGLITGRTETTLAPEIPANRAEAAMLLKRYLENTK
ncbi:MAG: S-layer homology domain-containing protein [Oscillospiraceae bacterium]|nr:S-layer homology domain-containing protein [Oscillospiraceae bacterium]